MNGSAEIALLGGSGFLGRHLAARLCAGEARVRVIARRTPREPLPAGAAFTAADALRADELAAALPRGGAVVDLAWDRAADPEENLAKAGALLEACRRAGVRRLVHLSTTAVSGPVRRRWIDETTACRPAHPYQRVKLELERRLRAGAGGELELVIVRPANVFGPGGANGRKVATDLLASPPPVQWLRRSLLGSRPMHLVQVATVAAAVEHLLELPAVPAGGLFIVGEDEAPGNDYLSVERVFRAALGLPPPRLPRLPLPPALLALALRAVGRASLHPAARYSSARLKATGFEPPLPFAAGLAAYARHLAAGPGRLRVPA